MPNNVDEKVVQLTFDNKQFEKGVAQSVKSLEDLKKALELDKMSESLRALEETTSSMSDNFGILQNSVNQVSKAFTPLGRIVIRAMDDMAGAIESRVKSFAKLATGMESLQAGQQKYEKYTKSVQVITNATGKSVDEVSKHLDKLLKYTDETSYDFSEMVSSIGKFTSVGIDLERAEAAMEGIANWAAKSGAGKMEANRAMYNISQAMGAGYMKLIDWKSIENANMATKEFKEVAIKTAEELGVIQKNSGITYQNFNETLKEGWLTADVMTEVLRKYSDVSTDFGLAAFHAAQEALTFTDAIDALKDAMSSGWMKTQEYLFGNLDEARVMWTDFANALIEFSDIFTSARNNILQSWHELGGYKAAVEAVSNAWGAFMNIAYAIRDVIASMFPPDFDEQLVAMTEHVRDITAGWKEMLGIDIYTEVSDEIDVMVNKAEQFTDTLKRGARGDSVRALQEQLVKAGYLTDKSGADGIYGPNTQNAVKKLQKALGVEVTGAWDKATRKAAIAQKAFMDTEKREEKRTLKNIELVTEIEKKEIDYAENLNKVLVRGNKGEEVKALQSELVRLGYLSDESQADGIYGPITEKAIKKLQKALKVDVTGAWDEETIAAVKAKKAMVEFIEEEKQVYKETSGVTDKILTIQDIVRGITSAIKTAVGIIGGVIKIIVNVLKIFQPLVAVGFRVIAMFMDMFTTMNEGIQAGDGIARISNAIVTALTPLAYLVLFVAQCIDDFVNGYVYFLNISGKKNSFISFFEYLATVFSGNWVVEGFISIFTSIKDIVVTTVDFILSTLKSLFGPQIDEVTGEPKQSGLVTFFQTALTLLGIAVQGIAASVQWFVNLLKSLFATIGEYLGPAKDSIGGFFTSLIEDVKSGKIKTFTDFFDSLNTALSKFAPITEKIKAAKDNFVSTFREMFDTINGESGDAEDTSAVSSLFRTVKAFLLTLTKFDFTKYLLPAIGALATYGFFKSAFSLDAFSDIIGMIFSNNGLKSGGLNKVSTKLFGAISVIALAIGLLGTLDISKVKEYFTELNAWFSETKIGKAFNSVKSTMQGWYEKAKEILQDKFPKTFEFFKKKWNSFKDFLKFDPDLTFFENLRTKFETLKGKISEIINDIKGRITDFISYIASLFKMNEEGTRLKLFDELGKLVSKFDGIVNFFIGLKDKFIATVQSIFSAADGEDPKKSGKGVFDLFGMIGKLLSKIGSLNIGKLLNTAIMGLLAYGWFNGSKALKNFSEGFDFFISKGAIKKDNFGDTALKLAGAIAVIALAVGLLSAIDLAKATGGIILAGVLVVAFVKLSKEFGKIKDEAAKDLGKQLLMMAGSIALLAIGIVALMGVVKLIEADGETAKKAFAILAGMLIGLTVIELLLKRGKGRQAKISNVLDMCKGVIYLVIALAGLMAIVKSEFKEDNGLKNIGWAFGLLTGLLAELFLIEFFLSRNKQGKAKNVAITGVLSMCIGVEILVMAFSHLLEIIKSNWGNLDPVKVAFAGLLTILLALGMLAKSMQTSTDAKSSTLKVGVLAIFMFAFAYAVSSIASSLSEAINNIKDIDLGIVITFMAAIGAFIGEYIGLVEIAKRLGSTKADIFKFVAVAGGFVAFAYGINVMAKGLSEAINNIKGADPWTVIAFLGGMSLLLIAFGAALKLLVPSIQLLGSMNLKTLIVGILALLAVGVELGILAALFTAIGDAALQALGDTLFALGNRVQSFANVINNIDWNVFKTNTGLAIEGIDTLIKGLILQSNDVVTALSIAEQVEDIGIQLQQLDDSLATISGDTGADMTAVQGFVDDTKTMVDTLNTISLNENVKNTLTGLGSALNLYYKMMQGVVTNEETGEELTVDLTQVDSKLLSDAFSAIAASVKPEDVKTIQSYAENEENDMLAAAVGINAIAEAIKAYGAISDGLDKGKIKTANGIIELMAGIPETLKNGDSTLEQLFSVFDGSNKSKLEKFGEDMYEVGNAVAHYITSIENINAGKLFMANATIGFLANLNNKLPQNEGGFLGRLLFGQSALTTFSASMIDLGTGIADYCGKVKDADFSKVPDSLLAVDTLADISGKLEATGGLNALIDGEKDLGTLGSGLGKLGENLMAFKTTTEGFEYKQVVNQLTAIEELAILFGDMQGLFVEKDGLVLNKMDQFGSGLRNMFQSIADIYGDTTVTKKGGWFESDETMPVIEAVAGLGGRLVAALSESMKESESGTEEGTGPIQKALTDAVINAAVAAKSDKILAYYIDTGRYLGKGIIQGFNENYADIINLMTTLGLEAPDKLRDVTKVQSPSKVFEEISKYWIEGSIKGINENAPNLINATDMLSKKVVSAFSLHPLTKDNPFGYLNDWYKETSHAIEDEAKIEKLPFDYKDADVLGLLPKDAKNPMVKMAEETQEAVKETGEVIRKVVDETSDLMLKVEKDLGRGSKGAEVKQLQEYLLKLGFMPKNAKIDGKFGPITEKALRVYQKEIGASQTGRWDLETRVSAKENGYKLHSNLNKLSQSAGIKRSDVDNIIKNTKAYEDIANEIEKNTDTTARVINRMIFDTKDYGISDRLMGDYRVAGYQKQIEDIDKQLEEVYLETSEGKHTNQYFDETAKWLMRDRRMLQMKQTGNYLKYDASAFSSEKEYWDYLDAEYGRFLRDIGYKKTDKSANLSNPKSRKFQMKVEDYIDKGGGIEQLLYLNANKQFDSITQKGFYNSALSGDNWFTQQVNDSMSNAGMEGAKAYTEGFSFDLQSQIDEVANEFAPYLGETTGKIAGDATKNELLNSVTSGDYQKLMEAVGTDIGIPLGQSAGESAGVNLANYIAGAFGGTGGTNDAMNNMLTYAGELISNGMSAENVKQAITDKIAGSGTIFSSVADTMVGEVVNALAGSITGAGSEQNYSGVRPVIDGNASTGFNLFGTGGMTIPSTISLDEASKITLSTIEAKIIGLNEKFDETAQKISALADYVQSGFEMVKNKDSNVYLDGDAIVGKIGSKVNKYIGLETYRASRNR